MTDAHTQNIGLLHLLQQITFRHKDLLTQYLFFSVQHWSIYINDIFVFLPHVGNRKFYRFRIWKWNFLFWWIFYVAVLFLFCSATGQVCFRWLPRTLAFPDCECIEFGTTTTLLQPFYDPSSMTTQVSRYQKDKPFWFAEAKVTGWQWHQLHHMQAICTFLQKITMPAPHHSDFYGPDAHPETQPTASKHWRCKYTLDF